MSTVVAFLPVLILSVALGYLIGLWDAFRIISKCREEADDRP